MTRIGILSDTHGVWDERYTKHFADCDEIWHAGDIGSEEVANNLEKFRPLRAVYGNVIMKHIGGYPGRYDASIRRAVYSERPQLFVSGHSHILKVQYDGIVGCLHINPGAAGKQGWHQVRTLVKVTIDGKEFKDLEVIELS